MMFCSRKSTKRRGVVIVISCFYTCTWVRVNLINNIEFYSAYSLISCAHICMTEVGSLFKAVKICKSSKTNFVFGDGRKQSIIIISFIYKRVSHSSDLKTWSSRLSLAIIRSLPTSKSTQISLWLAMLISANFLQEKFLRKWKYFVEKLRQKAREMKFMRK